MHSSYALAAGEAEPPPQESFEEYHCHVHHPSAPNPHKRDDMSNKNSAECDTKSECDCGFYSKYCEEIVTHINQDLLKSGGESDLYVPLHHNSPTSSSENKKERSNLSEIVLFPENNQAYFKNGYKDHPLLQSLTLENTGQFQAELSPGFSDCPSEAFPYVCDGSCNDNLCLNSKIPHLIITEKLDKEPYATDKEHQKQPLANYPSIQEKHSQISFLCKKEETGAHIHCECFEQSVIAEGNKTLDRKSTVSYSSECICHKKTTSRQLVKEHLECSSVSSSKTASTRAAEETYVHASSEGLTISLTLEAGTIDTIGSLAVDISPSKTREGKEDSQEHALTFKFTDSEHNNLFQKLCISIIPSISYSALLDTESQEQITPFTKQTGLPKILDDEASQPVTAHTKSPESSSPNSFTDQVPSTLKQWSAKQLLLARQAKPIHEAQSSYFFMKSFPFHTVAPKAEVQKHPLKAYRPVKSAVFTKNKEQKDKIFRSRPYIASEPNWLNTGAVDNFPYQSVKELTINKLDYSPLTWPTCHCSPLLDLAVGLLSKRKYSSTETFLKIHRKPHKQVGGDKVIPRISSQYLLNPRSSFEKLQCFFPKRKKNSLKMQSILTSCLGQAKGCNKHENDKGEVSFTLDNSNAVGNGLFAPCAPAHGRRSVTSPLPRTVNSCIHHSAALPPPSERRHSPTNCAFSVQTEREFLKLAGLCPDCKCRRISSSPHSAYIVNVIQSPKERNKVNSLCMEEPNLGTTQVACEDIVLKKFSVCPCGNVPQHGLFPSADNSWTEKKKTRTSPKINKKASILESNEVNCPKGTFDTVGACCTNCHHCFPTCFCFQSMNIQDASRNQFSKIQVPFENGFSNKNLKDFEEKSNARKNGRIHMGPHTLQEFSPSDTHAVPSSKDDDRTPKYVMYCPKCCSGCQTAVQHRDASKEVSNSLSSKQTMLNNCLNRKSVFLMDPGQRARSQCKCSQEISLFHLDQADIYKVHRAMLSKREESNIIQDSSG